MASHTLPGIGLTGGRTAGESGWATEMNLNLLLVSALLRGVKSRVTALPGSPVDGEIYIVPSGGDANKVAIRDASAWTYFVPVEGVRLWVEDEDITVVWNGTSWANVAAISEKRVVTDAATTRTGSLSDAHAYIQFTSGSATTFTVPPNSTVAFPIGTEIEVEQGGAGTVSISAGVGVTVRSRGALLNVAGQYGVVVLKKVATDTWTLRGDRA